MDSGCILRGVVELDGVEAIVGEVLACHDSLKVLPAEAGTEKPKRAKSNGFEQRESNRRNGEARLL